MPVELESTVKKGPGQGAAASAPASATGSSSRSTVTPASIAGGATEAGGVDTSTPSVRDRGSGRLSSEQPPAQPRAEPSETHKAICQALGSSEQNVGTSWWVWCCISQSERVPEACHLQRNGLSAEMRRLAPGTNVTPC